MLPAQVSYWTLQENKRHNLEMEKLTGQQIAEATRTNKENERIRVGTLEETKRNNLYSNVQGDYSLGITKQDADTRRFTAVNSAQTNLMQAEAAQKQASAAMMNAGTNQMVGYTQAALNEANARLSDTRSVQEQLTGTAQRGLMSSQKLTETTKQEQNRASADYSRAQANKTNLEAQYVDFYAQDRATQTDIKQQEATTHQFGKILDNITPWR